MPQVNVTTVLQIHPGAAAQTLHRDDIIFHPHRPAVDTWDRLREHSMLNFVALDKVTARNGGVRSPCSCTVCSVADHSVA